MTVAQRNVDSKRVIRSLLAAFVQDQCGFLAWLPRSVVQSPVRWIAALLKQKTLSLSNHQLTVRMH